MPARKFDADQHDPAEVAHGERIHDACGYRWPGSTLYTASGDHRCWRTSPEHRSHLCTCGAIELPASLRRAVLATDWRMW